MTNGGPDVGRIIAEVATRHGILLRPDDPGLALVTINRMVLEEVARELVAEMRAAIAEFERAVARVEQRAGTGLAGQVRAAGVALREEMQRDIDLASLRVREMVTAVDRTHRRPAVLRWVAVGVVAGAGLFAAGVWAGGMFGA